MATISTQLRSALLSAAASASSSSPRRGGRRAPSSVRCDASPPAASASASLDPDFDKKAFRHNLTRSDNYNRKGFGHKKETLELMSQEYTSDVIKTLKDNGNEYTWGPVTVKLAEAYGFCWGVERAVQIAYEARKQFPEERIWITNEIIHNPTLKGKRIKPVLMRRHLSVMSLLGVACRRGFTSLRCFLFCKVIAAL